MNFAYSWDGSVGFTMTVPNDRMIAVSSDMDMAIERAFQVVNAKEASDIAVLAKQIGVASIRSAYVWAKQHAKYRLSAEINWKRGREIRNHTLLDVDQFLRVAELIEQTSETTEASVTLSGVLHGVNDAKGTFQFAPTEGDAIQGYLSQTLVDRLSFSHPFKVPSNVDLSLVKRTKIHFSIEKEEVSWELVEWRQTI
jgi:hypothetical protein